MDSGNIYIIRPMSNFPPYDINNWYPESKKIISPDKTVNPGFDKNPPTSRSTAKITNAKAI